MTDLERVQVNAPQIEIDRWTRRAKNEQRSLSAWLRQLANTASKQNFKPVTFDVKDDGSQMHSHDRTLISKLGFSDADKSNNRHDLACQYLTSEAGAVFDRKEKCVGYLEQPLNKGDGKYKTTIGFVDVCGCIDGRAPTAKERRILAAYDDPDKYENMTEKQLDAGERVERALSMRTFVIEVKIKPVGVGDVLRQISLYREYAENLECLHGRGRNDAPIDLWGLVADFDLSNSALKALESADIHFARLGSGFEKWLKQAGGESSKKVKTL